MVKMSSCLVKIELWFMPYSFLSLLGPNCPNTSFQVPDPKLYFFGPQDQVDFTLLFQCFTVASS